MTKNNKGAAYNIGYGKPPETHRFRKGQSGNPRGRPRKRPREDPAPMKLEHAPSSGFLENELYRPLQLKENGVSITLPAMQAVMRGLGVAALKGNRLAAVQFIKMGREEERIAYEQLRDCYRDYASLKRQGEAAIARARANGRPPPELYPHPDDILLDRRKLEVRLVGPICREEVALYQPLMLGRDYFLGWSVSDEIEGRTGRIKYKGKSACGTATMAFMLDHFLPPSLRLNDNAMSRYSDWLSYNKRERARRLKAIMAQIRDPATIQPETIERYQRTQAGFSVFTDMMLAAADQFEKNGE